MPWGGPTAADSVSNRGAGRGNHSKGHDNERIAREHGQALAKGRMHGGHTSARGGIVETGQVVVHQ